MCFTWMEIQYFQSPVFEEFNSKKNIGFRSRWPPTVYLCFACQIYMIQMMYVRWICVPLYLYLSKYEINCKTTYIIYRMLFKGGLLFICWKLDTCNGGVYATVLRHQKNSLWDGFNKLSNGIKSKESLSHDSVWLARNPQYNITFEM